MKGGEVDIDSDDHDRRDLDPPQSRCVCMEGGENVLFSQPLRAGDASLFYSSPTVIASSHHRTEMLHELSNLRPNLVVRGARGGIHRSLSVGED